MKNQSKHLLITIYSMFFN